MAEYPLEEIRERLLSDEAEERRIAVTAIPDDGAEAGLMLIVSALGDASWRVRKEAVDRVATWRDGAAAGRVLVEVLVETEEVGLRNSAIEGLTRVGKPAVPFLTDSLRQPTVYRKFLLDALGAIGDMSGVDTLVAHLQDEDVNVRVAAAEALGSVGGERAVQALLEMIDREEMLVQLTGLDALADMGAQVPFHYLERWVSQPVIRVNALRLLEHTEDSAAVPHLAGALGDKTRRSRETAISGLHRMVKDHDESHPIRERAAASISEIPAASVARLIEAVDSRKQLVREGAAFLLGLGQRLEAIPRLAAGLTDGEICATCELALRLIGAKGIPRLQEAAEEADDRTRREIRSLLGALGAPSVSPKDPPKRSTAPVSVPSRPPAQAPPPVPAAPDRSFPMEKTRPGQPVPPLPAEQAAADALAKPPRRSFVPALEGDPIPLSTTEFLALRDVIHDHCGIYLQEDAAYRVQRRLEDRVRARNHRSFGDYVRWLRSPGGRTELIDAVERITTNETYFFREAYQLRAFCDEILPEIHHRRPRGRRLNIWSAGCSTGEEAYTIAMLVRSKSGFADWDVNVLGTDISRRVLEVARAGRYSASSLRVTDEAQLHWFFNRVGNEYEVKGDIRRQVSFRSLNLLDAAKIGELGPMDVIFCRNVIMYFGREARRRVIQAYHDQLLPGGYLLLGHSESLVNLSTKFELAQLRNDTVYRRPLGG